MWKNCRKTMLFRKKKKTGGNVTCQILEDGLGEYEQMKHKKAKKNNNNITYRFH